MLSVISGEVLAMQFASIGTKLILSSRNRDELGRVKQNIISMYADYVVASIYLFSKSEDLTKVILYFKGKNPDCRVEVLPMDLSSDEESLKEVVHAAESLFSNAGIDYMIHNAAFERPVSTNSIIFSVAACCFKSLSNQELLIIILF
jgi:dehydrogenase/reductase SDR family member 7